MNSAAHTRGDTVIAELDRKDAAELFDYLLTNSLRSVINGRPGTVSDRD